MLLQDSLKYLDIYITIILFSAEDDCEDEEDVDSFSYVRICIDCLKFYCFHRVVKDMTISTFFFCFCHYLKDDLKMAWRRFFKYFKQIFYNLT